MMRAKAFFILTLMLLLSSCGTDTAEKGRKPSADWSRGLPLSGSVQGTMGVAISDDGQQVHFVWPTTAGDEQSVIHYQQLAGKAELVVSQDLVFSFERLRAPRLLLAGPDMVHLFWAARHASSTHWSLWHGLLNNAGELVGDAIQVSSPEMNVGDYMVAQGEDSRGFVFWEERNSDDIYGVLVNGEVVESEPILLVEEAESPAAQVDETGRLHLAWIQDTRIHYDSFAGGELALTDGVKVADFVEGPADTIAGPVIGIAGNWATVLWSIYSRTGEEGGIGRTEYTSFRLEGTLDPSTPERLGLVPVEEQPYTPYASSYPLSQLAPPSPSPVLNSTYVFEANAAAGQGSELAAVLSMAQQSRLDTYIQLALVLFDEGRFVGYQMASKTDSLSQTGILLRDGNGNLHLAWREGAGGRRAYYATTASEARQVIDRLDGGDIANAILVGGMEAATGILFFPLALGWLLPGVLLLGFWKLRRDDEPVEHPLSRLMLFLALALYQGVKLLFLPTILSYVPFSAWLDVPASWSLPLRVVVPLMILGLGLFAAELLRRRKAETSALLYFVMATVIDAILTLAVYGVNFLGVF